MSDNNPPSDGSWHFWAVYFAVLGLILMIGWKQPLHYRFLSQEAINAIEHPATPPPATPPTGPATPSPEWMWKKDRPSPLEPGRGGSNPR